MKLKYGFLFLVFMVLGLSCGEKKLETTKMTIKGETFTIELARTQDEQTLGLMFRKKISDREGMLFIYDQYVKHGFWMKNVSIPLTVTFIGGDGKILDIKDMAPFSEKTVASRYSYRYALEVRQGLLSDLGVSIGDVLELPKGL
ncbi:MAG: DUF192 domain-containing protein [Spirochaetales bacterium]|nr:DUF192 domain-containing protein [Spirochaetales bacterium]